MSLTAERDTQKKIDVGEKAFPVKASTKIYKGSLVQLNAGYAVPASTATGRKTVGRAKSTVDNSSGADGDLTIVVEEGVFKWTNGDSIAQADVGKDCYATDDATVAKANLGTKSKAGKVHSIDADGDVWVETRFTDMELDSIPNVQAGSVTLGSGVGTVNTGITITASSKVIVSMNTPAGTLGTWGYEVKDADLVVGGPGVGTFVVRSINEDKTAATSDTSSLNYVIIG